MSGAVMLGPVIGPVVFARAPIEFELLLGFAATEPMETHVHRFGAMGLDVVVDDSKCGTVVGFDRGFRLFVAHLCEELAVLQARLRRRLTLRLSGFWRC